MFCPNCGRDNTIERKFCASCGTNLAVVSQALSGSDDDFFTKIDAGLDHFLGKYAEHVFKNAPANAAEQRIGKSWQVLGQSVLTSIVDLLLFTLMWNIIPLRFYCFLSQRRSDWLRSVVAPRSALYPPAEGQRIYLRRRHTNGCQARSTVSPSTQLPYSQTVNVQRRVCKFLRRCS